MTALNYMEPDKVPIDLASTTITSLTYPAYEHLRQFLQLTPDSKPKISHIHQGTVHPMEDLLQLYEIDFRTVYMKKSPRSYVAKKMPDGGFYDEDNILWKKNVYDYSPVVAPLAECTLEDLNKITWPDPFDPARVLGLKEEAKQLYETTEYAIVADIMCRGPFEQAVKLRGFEQFLVDISTDSKFTAALLDKITEAIIGLWDVYLAAVSDYVHVVCQGDDLGMQASLIISPKMYRHFIKPCHKRIYDFIHSKTKAKLFMHSCGSIFDIIPDFIEIGVDILNPIQRDAAKMEIGKLKKLFGKAICFWGGGIDTNRILPVASKSEIEDEVKRSIEIMADGGGYIFALTHNIQPDISPDRVDKVFRAVLKHREYPIAHYRFNHFPVKR
jgi:uroporphyrinogen decarboxylase